MLELIDGRSQATPVRIARPVPPPGAAGEVAATVERVRVEGDAALARPGALDAHEVEAARGLVPPDALEALAAVAERLRATSERQRAESWIEGGRGVAVGEALRPVRRAGICAELASGVLAAAIPAAVAGVTGIAVACPARPELLAACALAGVAEVYALEGAEAVAALAYGTESVRPVDLVVAGRDALARRALASLSGWVGTFAAGPRETVVIADESASGRAVAADLVASAEMGPGGTHALVTWIPEVVARVLAALEVATAGHERADDVENALIEGGRAVLVRDEGHALDTVEALAPERLALACAGAERMVERVRSAGAVFVGAGTPPSSAELLGAGGGLLPTGGAARWGSALTVRHFTKTIYVTGVERGALEASLAEAASVARLDGLPGHARAFEERLAR